jgi:peptidoglycan/xylan/chitin deacetylase (PgdA/CDA1 family)
MSKAYCRLARGAIGGGTYSVPQVFFSQAASVGWVQRSITHRLGYLLVFLSLSLLAGCAGVPSHPSGPPPASRAEPEVKWGKEYVIHIAGPGDTWASLAGTYLKDKKQGALIADFNKTENMEPGQQIVIPLVHPNPIGVTTRGYQNVMILCYHRFGPAKAKMVVTPEDFDKQMAYLKKNDYRVIPLTRIHAFLKGERALPQRAVVITIDDGYRSSYDIAYPILKKYGFPATLFVYSDFIGVRDGLGWGQIKNMIGSGLVDVQPHSKSHLSLTRRLLDESEEAYRRRVDEEIRLPGQRIKQVLGVPLHTFAYPYGDSDEYLISQLRDFGYLAGVTVKAGSNPAFANPFTLRRTMIYGDRDMPAFIKSLQVFTEVNLQ